MLAPPNRGSAVARKIRRAGFPIGGVFATCYGQAGTSHCLRTRAATQTSHRQWHPLRACDHGEDYTCPLAWVQIRVWDIGLAFCM